jgi:hypothetical protein
VKVRSTDISRSDHKSSEVFFAALMEMYTFEYALDMFARDGAITVSKYRDKVPTLDVWELGEEHYEALQKFKPNDIKIGCSYMTAQKAHAQYDLIVVDTPQGLHHDANGDVRTEHFSALLMAARLLKDGNGVLVLYVNKAPYNKDEVGSHGYDEYEEYNFDRWMEAREHFYDIKDGQQLTEDEAAKAYREILSACGWKVTTQMIVPCFSDVDGLPPYAFRIALQIEREA